jgi:hypothetical protein
LGLAAAATTVCGLLALRSLANRWAPALLATAAACGEQSGARQAQDASVDAPTSVTIAGVAQKGPFIRGSSVIIQELDASLQPTARTFLVETSDDIGHFSLPVHLNSTYVEIVGSGYYYDELSDGLSRSPLTLRAISDIAGRSSVNLNLLTTISGPRIRDLVQKGSSYADAQRQAQAEILTSMNFTGDPTAAFDALDITQDGDANAILLAGSLLLEQLAHSLAPASEVAEVSQLISQISASLVANDGKLIWPYDQKIRCSVPLSIDAPRVRQNLVNFYGNARASVTIPMFERYLMPAPTCPDAGPGDTDAGIVPEASDEAPSSAVPVEVSPGGLHTCVRMSDGTVRCWGFNAYGQLGLGNSNDSPTPQPVSGLSRVVQIASGFTHTCAVRDDHTVWCWGRNDSYQLGDGTTVAKLAPAQVPGLSAQQVAAGEYQTCALLLDGTVKCWGNVPTDWGTTPTPIAGITGAVQLDFQMSEACAIDGRGSVQCWGTNSYVPLEADAGADAAPVPATNFAIRIPGFDGALQVGTGEGHVCALMPGGTAACIGWNVFGQSGQPSTINVVQSVTTVPNLAALDQVRTGSRVSCAHLADRSAKCWGVIADFQNYQSTAVPTAIAGLGPVASIRPGQFHICALLDSSSVKCWGRNDYGQLGDGSRANSLTPVTVGF